MVRWGVRTAIGAVVALLVMGVCVAGEVAQPAAAPSYCQNEGDQAKYTFSNTGVLRATLNDGTIAKGTMAIRMVAAAQFFGLSPEDNTIHVEAQILSGSVTQTVGKDRKTAAYDPSMARYDVTPRGEIKNREVGSSESNAGTFFSPTPEDCFLVHGIGVLPKKTPKAGDTWSGTLTSNAPGLEGEEQMQVKYSSKLLGQTTYAGKSCWKIKTDYRLFTQSTSADPEGNGSMTLKAKYAGTDTWLFAPTPGMVMKADGTAKVTVTVLIDFVGEGQNSVAVTGTLEDHAKMTELNGAPVAAK